MKINQMKKDELFEGFYLIKSAEVRQTRAGKNYLAFTFQDDTGVIEGKLWDAQPHNVAELQRGKSFTCKDAVAKSTITPRRLISWPCACQKLVSPTILLISKKNHRLIKKNCGNTWRKWFLKLKIKSGSAWSVHFTANTIRNFIPTQQRKPITMLLSQV